MIQLILSITLEEGGLATTLDVHQDSPTQARVVFLMVYFREVLRHLLDKTLDDGLNEELAIHMGQMSFEALYRAGKIDAGSDDPEIQKFFEELLETPDDD